MSQFLFQDEVETPVTSIPESTTNKLEKCWHILIVDDEPAIHDVTQLVLKNSVILDRKLVLHSAYSAQEAKTLLQSDIQFCMGFIDVVMENDHAGLDLINWIRKDLKNNSIRLILRTGQAGTAPEESVISQYDIHDYKTKTELTQRKMTTCVYSAIRSYRDISTISKSLDAFKKLIASSTSILKVDKISEFASAALTNLLSLMGLDSSSVYIVRHEVDLFNNIEETYLACSGKFGQTPDNIENMSDTIKRKINQVFTTKGNEFTDSYFISYYKTSHDASAVLYIEFNSPPTGFQSNLAEIFSTNVALVLESLVRHQQSETNQRELMYILGDAIEARSKETGAHVKRTALLCYLLAQKLEMPEAFCDAIKAAAPLHDIGKITVPERILHKPGKLDADEWEIMKQHAEAGGAMLARSALPIAQLGKTLAHYHHENWDGSGYPDGLAGENIPIEARIMALVDVIDALGSKRCYKPQWEESEILHFIKSERGLKFQPVLVDIAEKHFSEIMDIRNKYPD
ncbi:phosphodiesterase [Psychromonas sp. psych-6C06]|uniref:response regulator n=1 Tax=Psychromonas sp. psych-6C06 TaxID=2058089 RepID=UPI000C34811C|nr:response regulator [Psychromonas sp. psych-6C06]PKF62700.1 phosphodiesterase [Psychromonas sp. psych-6C06]